MKERSAIDHVILGLIADVIFVLPSSLLKAKKGCPAEHVFLASLFVIYENPSSTNRITFLYRSNDLLWAFFAWNTGTWGALVEPNKTWLAEAAAHTLSGTCLRLTVARWWTSCSTRGELFVGTVATVLWDDTSVLLIAIETLLASTSDFAHSYACFWWFWKRIGKVSAWWWACRAASNILLVSAASWRFRLLFAILAFHAGTSRFIGLVNKSCLAKTTVSAISSADLRPVIASLDTSRSTRVLFVLWTCRLSCYGWCFNWMCTNKNGKRRCDCLLSVAVAIPMANPSGRMHRNETMFYVRVDNNRNDR